MLLLDPQAKAPPLGSNDGSALVLRRDAGADGPALARLAELETRPLPAGPFLVAEREGRIDAAISLVSGEVLADPFRPTAGLAALLGVRAKLGE